MRVKTTVWSLIVFVTIALPVSAVAGDVDCRIADEAIEQASALRNLKITKKVPCFVQDKPAVKERLLSILKEKLPPNRLRDEGNLFRSIGFLPPDFDYEHGLIDLYVSQLGGFYDPSKKYFVMAAWIPAILQMTVAVHEQTHALQDQHFNLDKFMDPGAGSGDELLARSALVEGDATAVMMDYTRRLLGKPPIGQESDVESVMLQNVIGGAISSTASGVPRGLQLTLIFPYTSGLRFAHGILKRGGTAAIDQAFRAPPRSTTEILHPEKYGAFPELQRYTDSDVIRADQGEELIYGDTIGEFVMSALLSGYSSDAQLTTGAAAGWAGDRAVIFKRQGQGGLRWISNWSSEGDAAEFVRAFQLVIAARYPAAGDTTATIEQQGSRVTFEAYPLPF